MSKIKDALSWIGTIAITILVMVIFNIFIGISTYIGIFLSSIVLLLCLLSGFAIFIIIKNHLENNPVKKAKKEELRREDDVLLQATAFSQSFILLSSHF